tara:strand:+ start:244 stop:795 length:552 start_codon:yes stop_codon:yes gene_type:complete
MTYTQIKEIITNKYSNFSGLNIEKGSFESLDLRGANFDKTCLIGAFFEEADCGGANFTCANLTGADFDNTYLEMANFSSANLENCFFGRATLNRANFYGSYIAGANFSKSDLSFAKGIRQWQSACESGDIWYTVGSMFGATHKCGMFWGTTEEAIKYIRNQDGENSETEKLLLIYSNFVQDEG